MKTTAALLDQAAPWTGYFSPNGFVIWLKRIVAALAGTVGGVGSMIPDYPAGPPLGFSLNLTSDQLHGEMVVPVKSLENLADYIKSVEGL